MIRQRSGLFSTYSHTAVHTPCRKSSRRNSLSFLSPPSGSTLPAALRRGAAPLPSYPAALPWSILQIQNLFPYDNAGRKPLPCLSVLLSDGRSEPSRSGGHELGQSARFKKGRHQGGVTAGIHIFGHGVRIVHIKIYFIRVRCLYRGKNSLIPLLSAAQYIQLYIFLQKGVQVRRQNIQSFCSVSREMMHTVKMSFPVGSPAAFWRKILFFFLAFRKFFTV